jgi:DNA invertase Pin-like site-specific DNA recombinase
VDAGFVPGDAGGTQWGKPLGLQPLNQMRSVWRFRQTADSRLSTRRMGLFCSQYFRGDFFAETLVVRILGKKSKEDKMAIYGYVRCSGLRGQRQPEPQIEEIARKALELGGGLEKAFIDRGDGGKKTVVLARPAGKEMLETLKAGDTLIITRLDRLGFSVRDVEKTLGVLAEREVRVYPLHGVLEGSDIEPGFGTALPKLFAMRGHIEKALRSERFTELARQRKEQGLAYGSVPMGKMVVERDGVKHLAWDHEQLGYIAEIACRLPQEGAAKVAEDFWRPGHQG